MSNHESSNESGVPKNWNGNISDKPVKKLGFIAVLTLLLLVPLQLIDSLVYERQARHRGALAEIQTRWGSHQTLTGPILRVPYYTNWIDTGTPDPSSVKHAYFLPAGREIASDGFNASWSIYYLSRSFPQMWASEIPSATAFEETAFGVNFFQPVDAYVQTGRAIKYAILFILLTFSAFFLFEILARLQVHAIQYLLIGGALTLFYLLLLALSEHLGFALSYSLATGGTVLLVSLYSASVLCGFKRAGAIAPLLVVLYAYLYILLQAEDFSLLFGSIGLFVILSAFMYLTRNFDWSTGRLIRRSVEKSSRE